MDQPTLHRNRSMMRFPRVHGGALAEAVGGPFDGDLLYVPRGTRMVDVYVTGGDRRLHTTIRIGKAHGPNWVGYYSTRGFDVLDTERVWFYASRSEEDLDTMRRTRQGFA